MTNRLTITITVPVKVVVTLDPNATQEFIGETLAEAANTLEANRFGASVKGGCYCWQAIPERRKYEIIEVSKP
jgi:hypothetical protein